MCFITVLKSQNGKQNEGSKSEKEKKYCTFPVPLKRHFWNLYEKIKDIHDLENHEVNKIQQLLEDTQETL